MRYVNMKFLAIFLGIVSVLLYGTPAGLVFGIAGVLAGVHILIKKGRKKDKKLAKAGCLVSAIGILLYAVTVISPGISSEDINTTAISYQEDILGFVSKSIPKRESDLLQQASQFIADISNTEAYKPQESQEETQLPETNNADISDMTVHFLDVGQGLSILIESDGHYMLYDGGDRTASSFVVSYLKKEGVGKLDYVIASHYDADHLNGVVGALNVFPTDKVLAPDYEADSRVYQSFINIINEKQIPLIHPSVGSEYSLGSASFTVLGPLGSDYKDVNDYSIVIMLQNGSDRLLITGDSEYTSEEELCISGADLACDVYVAGHHGSGTSSSWKLLQNAVPEYVVISCGEGNSYGHPHDSTMEKFESMELSVFRTDKQGTILCVSSGSGIEWSQEPCNDYTPGE